MTDLGRGSRAGKYTIDAHIASGGFGSVYRATGPDGAAVAIKVMHAELLAEAGSVERFEREIAACRRLSHPNAVAILDVGELDDRRPYFVMELLAGRDLLAHLRDHGRVSAARALEIMTPICAALGAAHRIGIVHRDIKASNVFLADDGRRPVLLDFGLAKLLDDGSDLTRSRQALGTPTSMAPEQIAGKSADARTDVYALGVLLFQLVTGHVPFSDESATVVQYMHRYATRQRPSVFAAVPRALDAVVLRAMAVDPDDRFESASRLVAALEQVVDGSASAPARGQPAVGVYVALREPSIDSLEIAHGEMWRRLEALGFSRALDSARSLLAIAPVPEGGSGALRQMAAGAVRDAIASLGIEDSCGAVVAAGTAVFSGMRPTGGPLMSVDDWVGPDDLRGVIEYESS